MARDQENLTQMLRALSADEPGAADALAEAIHDDLRAMARRHLARDFGRGLPGVTIQPTVLANDTLMKLIRQRQQFDSAGHFFAIASRVMMRVLLDYHRERKAAKRGGGAVKVSLDADDENGTPQAAPELDVDVEAIDEALRRLEQLNARKAEVVRYRILWGMSVAQTAEALGVARATIERDWIFARAWLAKELLCLR